MNSIYFVFIIVVAIIQRVDASFPLSFHGYPSYVPYVRAVAAPAHIHAPVVHAAPSFYSFPVAYPQRQRELRNFAGAFQRESGLLTDVTIRFPLKKL
ncbi:hypothetical protein Y032_0116g626 [Ancylostoma ceylanicum]|uniref:Uncharacterized protein n=1 Tax=Ancylostoma ceylanicum TaxID=53326 RepID=A0A016TCQ7_9BILA|nr:hypothetical protein Y032_0116g626 [Ancylostoma ceylanicum]